MRHLLADPRLAALLPDVPAWGDPISVEFSPSLSVTGGKLRSDVPGGRPVHAAAFLSQRRLVLDSELETNKSELQRILLHELFHFVWWRLGQPRRNSYSALLLAERYQRARGELGWSAERIKPVNGPYGQGRRWREYLSESFCDTAAWYFLGTHPEVTLALTFRERRRQWLESTVLNRPLAL